MKNSIKFQVSALALLLVVSSAAWSQTYVRMETVLGDIDIELFDDIAPVTVANFLNYVNDGDYDGTFIHRSSNAFVTQGGGFALIEGAPTAIPTDPPIVNEFNMSNLRGTVAMAKPATGPDTATSQWFFNLADNSALLDMQNGGFTVFGRVIGNSMEVVDAIAASQLINVGVPFDSLPVRNFSGGTIEDENLINVTRAFVLDESMIPGANVIINPAMNGSWFNAATAGQGFFIDVLPTTGIVFLSWFTYDVAEGSSAKTAIGDAGHRWLTAAGAYAGNSATLDITLTTGGVFDDPTPVTNSEAGTYGSITLTFDDCNSGQLTYEFVESGLTGTIPITRVIGDNVALCQELSLDLEDAQ